MMGPSADNCIDSLQQIIIYQYFQFKCNKNWILAWFSSERSVGFGTHFLLLPLIWFYVLMSKESNSMYDKWILKPHSLRSILQPFSDIPQPSFANCCSTIQEFLALQTFAYSRPTSSYSQPKPHGASFRDPRMQLMTNYSILHLLWV